MNRHHILFDGDSITDSGRSSGDGDQPLGNGYVRLISEELRSKYPKTDWEFSNFGVAGNRSDQIRDRWKPLNLSFNPSLVSIMIGINDTNHRYRHEHPTSSEDFLNQYRELLELVRTKTNAPIIIMQPFYLNISEEIIRRREDLHEKHEVLLRLLSEIDAHYIPLDSLFQEACKLHPPAFWAEDGIHPTREGHRLIASAWIDTFEKII